MSKQLMGLVAGFALALAVGCSSSNNNPKDGGGGAGATGGAAGTGPVDVMISGVASPHPLMATLDPSAAFDMLKISVVDPAVEIVRGPALQSMTLDTSAANCSAGSSADGGTSAGAGCGWSFDAVDIGGITLGLVGKIEDLRTGSDQVWLRTGTGMGDAGLIAMEKMSKAPLTMRHAFAVTHGMAAKLATFGGAVLGTTLTGADLEGQGFMIGHVVGKLSEGAPPIAGATVTVSGTATDRVDIIYPNATFDAPGTSTAAHGMFLVVAKAQATPTAVVASWQVSPPAGDARSWPAYTAGTDPGGAFVILMVASE